MAYVTKQTKGKIVGICALCVVVVFGMGFLTTGGLMAPTVPQAPTPPQAPAAPTPPNVPEQAQALINGSSTAGAGQTESGNLYAFDCEDVDRIAITWLAGSASVRTADVETIEVREYIPSNSRALPMTCTLNGAVLEIDYCEGGQGLIGCTLNYGHKQLEILIPEHKENALQLFALDAASGTYDFEGLSAQALRVSLASGALTAQGVAADEFSLEMASGTLDMNGEFGAVDAEVASGNATIACTQAPRKANLSLASGQLGLVLPETASFKADVDKVAGNFAVRGFDATQHDNEWICGEGEIPIAVDIASGTVEVRSAKA